MSTDELIKKHLEFVKSSNDKWWLQSSVKHYLENGTVTGSFFEAINKIVEESKNSSNGRNI